MFLVPNPANAAANADTEYPIHRPRFFVLTIFDLVPMDHDEFPNFRRGKVSHFPVGRSQVNAFLLIPNAQPRRSANIRSHTNPDLLIIPTAGIGIDRPEELIAVDWAPADDSHNFLAIDPIPTEAVFCGRASILNGVQENFPILAKTGNLRQNQR